VVTCLCVPSALAASGRLSPHSETRAPVLAFYYMWYHRTTWCHCTMPDLPIRLYDSSDGATIDRQISQAAGAGITGFITSWPGPGTTQDANLRSLFAHIAAYRAAGGAPFVSSIYLECDMPAIRGNLAGSLRYALMHYASNPDFFHWHGKPVIFVWDPLGGGRTLGQWASVRRAVDPSHHSLWIAEGTNMSLLTVFDGIHLYSAADWALSDHSIAATDRSFQTRVAAYNAAHRSARLWIAGVMPGYDDRRVPGRVSPSSIPRDRGATYRESWAGALASSPTWITITSWNEWFEGTAIEPGRRDGRWYLDLTKQLH